MGFRRSLEWSIIPPLVFLVVSAMLFWAVDTRYQTYKSPHFPVTGDGEGYYAYLPAYFVRHDPSLTSVVVDSIVPSYAGLGHQPAAAFGFSKQPNGAWLDKYGLGTALMMLPFFASGHLVAVLFNMGGDGYSSAEVLAVSAAALVYVVAGLFLIRALLRRWLSDLAIASTLAALAFGTGLLYYSTAQTMSHAYSFFAVSAMLLTAVRWYEQPRSWLRAGLLGAAVGMVVAIRLPNALFVTAVPMMGVGSLHAARDRLGMLARHVNKLTVMVLLAGLCLIPQVAAWKIATGHFIIRPYGGEGFDLVHPHLIESLLWVQPHGLLPYYPVLAFSFAGCIVMWRRRRDLALPVTVSFLLFWYVTSSWWDWSFSDAFGDRAYVDALPLLAVPMALLFGALTTARQRCLAIVVASVLIAVNLEFLFAYWHGSISGSGAPMGVLVNLAIHPRWDAGLAVLAIAIASGASLTHQVTIRRRQVQVDVAAPGERRQ